MGEILIRNGISFHKNGKIRAFEPVSELTVNSPIGIIKVFDPDPNGIQAESHSLCFKEDGAIQSVITSSNQVVAEKDGAEYKRFSPKIVTSYCNENAFFISPLKIEFGKDSLNFNNINESIESIPKELHYKIIDFVSEKPISEVGCE